MLNTLNVNLNTDLKVSRVPELGIKIKSQDINNNLFILRFTHARASARVLASGC